MATLYYRPYTTDLQNDDDSKSTDISHREGLLPEYQYIFDPDKDSVITEQENLSNNEEENSPDLNRYKLAMRRMSTEIFFLRNQMKNLMHRNTELHCGSCGHHKEAALLVREVIDVNSISKEELLNKYMVLNSKCEEAYSNLSSYKDKVHNLQLELIKKNDREAEFIKINKAHSSQNVLIQNLQKRMTKIKILEDTVKDQEIIIAKMEKQIEKNKDNTKSRNLSPIREIMTDREKEYHSKLQEENIRLKYELENVKSHQEKPSNPGMSDSERLELYQLLDKAEQRIMALEKQISNSHKEWQKEKNFPEADEFGLSKIKF